MSTIKGKRLWQPGISFGDYHFGDPIASFEGILEYIPEESDDFWDAYKESNYDDIRIYSEAGIIVCIGSYEYFYYGNENLIGNNFNDVIKMLNAKYNQKDIQEVMEAVQTVYNFNSIGMVIWVENGLVANIQCSDIITECE